MEARKSWRRFVESMGAVDRLPQDCCISLIWYSIHWRGSHDSQRNLTAK